MTTSYRVSSEMFNRDPTKPVLETTQILEGTTDDLFL